MRPAEARGESAESPWTPILIFKFFGYCMLPVVSVFLLRNRLRMILAEPPLRLLRGQREPTKYFLGGLKSWVSEKVVFARCHI